MIGAVMPGWCSTQASAIWPGATPRAAALRLLREAKVGVAPGTAFGPEGEGCIRMCFAISTELAREAVARLTRFFGLARRPT